MQSGFVHKSRAHPLPDPILGASHSANSTSQFNAEFNLDNSAHLRELRQVILRKLIYATIAILGCAHIWITAYWLDLQDWGIWYATLSLMLVGGSTLLFLERRPRLAAHIWQGGLLLLIPALAYWLHTPELMIFLVLLPLMAVVTTGARLGFLLWLGLAALIWWGGAWIVPTPGQTRVILILAALISGVVGWALVSSLFLAIHWATLNFERATRNMAAAREHRAQLMGLYKSLDQAYYQLERTNAALVAAWKTIEEAERFKSEFVANVSHELRTPLNLIVGFSEMMITSPESYGGVPLPGRYRSDLNTIARNAQHLLALADDVLDLTRIEVGKIALAREDVDLAKLVEDVAGMLREYVSVKGLALHIEIEPDLPTLWIDRLRMRQVLLNLLTNAARHTEQGRLVIQAERGADEVIIRVADTGRGIPPDALEHIFAEFQSTYDPRAPWGSGAGLGLPISRKFVELHGGRMGVESTYGEGACFWFTLPLTAPVSEAPPSPTPPSPTPRRAQPLARLGNSERIVVVLHPDAGIASVLKRYLDGYQVIRAETPTEAVHLVHEVKALALIHGHTGAQPSVAANGPPQLPTQLDDAAFVGLPDQVLVIECPLPSSQASASVVGAEELLIKPIARQELLAALDRHAPRAEKVLIVDDEPEMVRLCRKMLRGRVSPQGCLEAFNGVDALEILQRETVDAVILDLAMPQMDGRQFLAQMARDPALARLPVILISGTGQAQIKVDVPGEIRIRRTAELPLGDIVHALNAVFTTLAPGWQQLNASAPGPRAARAEKPASPENPPRPAPAPDAVR